MMLFSKQPLSMATIYWLGRRLLDQLGWAGLLGCAFVLISIIYLTKSYVLAGEVEANQKLLGTKQQLANRAEAHQKTDASVDSETQLSTLYDVFPNKSDLSASLLVLKQKSTQHQVTLNEGRYKYSLVANHENASHFSQYEIKFPVTGHYVNIRAFVDDILLQLPTLAIREMHLQREGVADSHISADLSLVLFVRGALHD